MNTMQMPKAKEAQLIEACRRIVEAGAFEDRGTVIVLFSASVVLSVYEGLSKKNLHMRWGL